MTDTVLVVILVIVVIAAAVFGILVDRGFFNREKKEKEAAEQK